ncbi:Uncharacterized membrane protein YesL [Ruminococcaceae bacterium YAD3003]|nr:Uncharacterized membrane protein YesL [Ruminococcaceae bacterium YAD3003]
MKKSFDQITNSWLYKTSQMVGDVVIISVLFLLFCIPVVTIGPSITALYYTVYRKYQKKSDSLSKDFIRSFKDNLKNGIAINLIYLAYLAVAGFNIYFAFNGLGSVKLPDWYTVVSFIPLLPVIFTIPFVYPLLARFSNGIKGTITNSFTLCMINFPKFFLIWLIQLAAIAVSVLFPPAALVTPVASTYLCQMITEKAIANAIRVEQSREETKEAESYV